MDSNERLFINKLSFQDDWTFEDYREMKRIIADVEKNYWKMLRAYMEKL
jgi:hypothetical protein